MIENKLNLKKYILCFVFIFPESGTCKQYNMCYIFIIHMELTLSQKRVMTSENVSSISAGKSQKKFFKVDLIFYIDYISSINNDIPKYTRMFKQSNTCTFNSHFNDLQRTYSWTLIHVSPTLIARIQWIYMSKWFVNPNHLFFFLIFYLRILRSF